MKTECSKCGASAPTVEHRGKDPMSALFKASFVMTGFSCKSCAHCNDYKHRKWYAEWKTQKGIK